MRQFGPVRRVAAIWAMAALLSACGVGSTPASSTGGGKVEVVAAENFWGSIASQVGGDRAHVTSVIVNPDTDPHAYEPTPSDARLIAGAKYVIVNGAGYDSWAPKLLDANPVTGRTVLTVGDFIGKKEGDNPHLWYSAQYVDKVIDKIATDLTTIDPGDASYFESQRSGYKTTGLKAYHDTINAIRAKYTGTPVGATESIFSYLAADTGLNLITPYEYLKAISEGTDPSPADKATVLQQIAGKKIKVLGFNMQNSTPDVQSLVNKAKAQGIQIAQVTETLTPADITFQDWQTNQLKELLPLSEAEPQALAPGGLKLEEAGAFENAGVSLGGRFVWRGVDLSVSTGEFVAILGPNGAGKSTLLKALLGVVPLAEGKARIFGKPVRRGNDEVGYLPQRRRFDPDLRIRAVDLVRLGLDGAKWGVTLPAWLRGSRMESDRGDSVIRLVGAESYASRPIGELSGGEQQRVLIAQALVTGAQMLALDEPLDSLDLNNQQSISALVRDICQEQGVTVLLVAHDVNPILPFIDRVVYAANGQVVSGRPEDVIQTDTLSRLYGAPVEVLRTSERRVVVVGQHEPVTYHAHDH